MNTSPPELYGSTNTGENDYVIGLGKNNQMFLSFSIGYLTSEVYSPMIASPVRQKFFLTRLMRLRLTRRLGRFEFPLLLFIIPVLFNSYMFKHV